jgi:hypothetical protein
MRSFFLSGTICCAQLSDEEKIKNLLRLFPAKQNFTVRHIIIGSTETANGKSKDRLGRFLKHGSPTTENQ